MGSYKDQVGSAGVGLRHNKIVGDVEAAALLTMRCTNTANQVLWLFAHGRSDAGVDARVALRLGNVCVSSIYFELMRKSVAVVWRANSSFQRFRPSRASNQWA